MADPGFAKGGTSIKGRRGVPTLLFGVSYLQEGVSEHATVGYTGTCAGYQTSRKLSYVSWKLECE